MAVVLEAQESLIGIVKLATVGVETQIKEENTGVQFNLYTEGKLLCKGNRNVKNNLFSVRIYK
jgi:hypothetical protein